MTLEKTFFQLTKMSIFSDQFLSKVTDELLSEGITISPNNLKKVISRVILNFSNDVKNEEPVERSSIPTVLSKQDKDQYTCEHTLLRGGRAGQLCGSVAKFEFGGKWYCGTEKKDDKGNSIYGGHIRTVRLNTSKAKSQPKPKSKKAEVPFDPDEKARKLLKMTENKQTQVRKHPTFEVIYHPPTMIVVDPNLTKALGCLNKETGEVTELTKEQKHICDINNWKYDRQKNKNDDLDNEDESEEEYEEDAGSKDQNEDVEIKDVEIEEEEIEEEDEDQNEDVEIEEEVEESIEEVGDDGEYDSECDFIIED